MLENKYKLIDLDQMEASVVRRRLRRWTKGDEQAIIPLIHALQRRQCLSNVRIVEPRYETNVYPLYFYWRCGQKVSHRQVYDRVFRILPTERLSMPKDELCSHVAHTVDSEVDILVEDVEYFVFIEAKEVAPGAKVKFEKKGDVHQLVSQYIQGKILEKVTSKTFALATIGANKGKPLEIPLNATERALLQLVHEDKATLPVIDLSWPSLTADGGK